MGDAGARGYLAGNPDLTLVECGDLADPDDVDTPEQLARFIPLTRASPGSRGRQRVSGSGRRVRGE